MHHIYILVSWWLIINLFTRNKSNTMTCVTSIYTIIHDIRKYTQIYTNINKYTQFYVHSECDRYINTTCPLRLVRGGISQPRTRTRTPRETRRDQSTNNVHTNFMYSRTQLTTKAIIYNLHEPQFNCENLSSYAHMPTCAPRRPGCSAYRRRHIGITL